LLYTAVAASETCMSVLSVTRIDSELVCLLINMLQGQPLSLVLLKCTMWLHAIRQLQPQVKVNTVCPRGLTDSNMDFWLLSLLAVLSSGFTDFFTS